MRIPFPSFFALLLLSVSAVANAADKPANAPDAEVAQVLIHEEAARRELSSAMAEVKSASQFARYMQQTRGSATPFSAMTPGALRRFSRSLVFTDRGLASYDYTDLQRELTASQIYAVLRVFGVEGSVSRIPGVKVRSRTDGLVMDAQRLPADYNDMTCAARASCAPQTGWICTSNC